MNLTKQLLMLSHLITSPDIYNITSGILKDKYFDPEARGAMAFIHEYFTKYNNLPNRDEVLAETNIELKDVTVEPHQYEYILDSIEDFCKEKACELAIIDSVQLMEKGDRSGIVELVTKAASVSLHRDMGLNYFIDPEERINRTVAQSVKILTGYHELDKITGGLIRPGLHIFSANSGGGKSLLLGNIGLNMVEQGFNVLYITLELDETFVSSRFDTMISGIPEAEIAYKKQQVIDKIKFHNNKAGSLHIKYMDAQSKTEDIMNYIIQFGMLNNFYPDCLIVDYLDLVEPNGNKYDGAFERDKKTSEQLRNMGKKFNFSVLTASQQNREAVNAGVINHSHIAGGISKINTCDLLISIIFDDQMKAAGELDLYFLKTRYSAGVGQRISLKYDPVSMRVTNPSFFQSNQKKSPSLRDNCSLIDNLEV